MKGFDIHQMARDELVIPAGFTAAEGWLSEDQSAFEGFYQYDPAGGLLDAPGGWFPGEGLIKVGMGE